MKNKYGKQISSIGLVGIVIATVSNRIVFRSLFGEYHNCVIVSSIFMQLVFISYFLPLILFAMKGHSFTYLKLFKSVKKEAYTTVCLAVFIIICLNAIYSEIELKFISFNVITIFSAVIFYFLHFKIHKK